MARTKSIPVRKTAYGTTRTIVSGPSLNTRIHRILNAKQEMKTFVSDGSYPTIANATGWQFYVNPLTGIGSGTSSTQRVGDQITIYKIEVSAVVYNSTDNTSQLDLSHRLSLIRQPDIGFTASSPTVYTGRYTSTGFSSNGVLDDTHNTVYADRKAFRSGSYTSLAGAVLRSPLNMTKSFGMRGVKMEYQSGSSTLADRPMLIISAGDCAADVVGSASNFTVYLSFCVWFRDA